MAETDQDRERRIRRALALLSLQQQNGAGLDMGEPVAQAGPPMVPSAPPGPAPVTDMPPLVPSMNGSAPLPMPEGWYVEPPQQAVQPSLWDRIGSGARGLWDVLPDADQPIGPGIPSGSDAAAWLNSAGEAMTAGLVGDEASAYVDSLIGRGTYDDRLQFYRDQQASMSPAARVSSEIGGSIIPALLGAGAMTAPTLMGNIGRGAGLGAGYGTTYAFMEGEGLGDRLTGAAVGGGLGGMLGAAIPVAGAVGGNIGARVAQAARDRRLGGTLGAQLGVQPATGSRLAELTYGLDRRAMDDALLRAGPDAMLADADLSFGRALGSYVNTPNPGSQMAVQRVNDRAAQAVDPVVDALAGGNERTSVNAAIGAARREAQPEVTAAYREAYTTPIDYASPEGRRVQDVFDAIPDRIVARAVRDANEAMRWDMANGRLPPDIAQIHIQIADDGAVTLGELPNVGHLDYIKRALDGIAEGSRDIRGTMSSEGRLASDMARTLRNAVSDAVPAYRDALALASDDFATRNAIEFGSQLLDRRTTTFDSIREISNMTPAERQAARIGLAEDLQETLGNVMAVASDPNVDARQASDLIRRFTSDNAQAKMQALFGDEWPAMQELIDQATAAASLRASVARRSDTAGNIAEREAVRRLTEPSSLAQGRPLDALRSVVSEVTGASPAAQARIGGEVYSELADLLTRSGQGTDILDAVTAALMRNPATPNRAQDINRLMNITGLAGVPQAVRQSLAATQERTGH